MRFDDAYKQLSSTTSQPVLTSHLNKLRQNQQAGSTDIQQLIPKAETIRQYQIFSEAHSIKALCLERKKSATSPVNKQEEQDIIDSFEIASLLAIQHSILIYHLLNPQLNNNSINNANNSNVINHPGILQKYELFVDFLTEIISFKIIQNNVLDQLIILLL